MQEKRLIILTDGEIEEMYGFPIFTEEQRSWYFSLSSKEWRVFESVKSTSIRVDFLLQLAYFKAKSMFFSFNLQDVPDDVRYVMQEYFPKQRFPKKNISIDVQLRNRTLVVSALDYKLYKSSMKSGLEQKASQIVSIGVDPVFVFREMLLYLENTRISLPAYSVLQDIIGTAITNEQIRINQIVALLLTPKAEEALDHLLSKDDNWYEVTALKKKPKEFTYKEMEDEINKHHANQYLYGFAKEALPKLSISKQNIQHYAGLAEYYTVYKLRRMPSLMAKLYLLCFVYHRFQQINDNLIACFLYYVNKYKEVANKYAQEKVYEYKVECNENLAKVGQVLDLFTDDAIPESMEFKLVKGKAFSIIPKEKWRMIKTYISGMTFDKTEYLWEGYQRLAHKIRKNLRPIFRCLNFEAEPTNSLIAGIQMLLSQESNLTVEQAKKFISPSLLPYLCKKDAPSMLSVDKFEFLVYQKIQEQLDSGEIFCRDTTKFKSLSEDLISDQKWKNKDQIIEKLGIPKLSTSIDTLLQELEEVLETRLVEVNERIKNGENKDINLQTGKDGSVVKWTLPYNAQDDIVNNPFYEHLPQVSIIDILRLVDSKCNFMKAFTPVQLRYSKKRHDNPSIMACIIADGTSLGIYKMSDICELSLQTLSTAQKNFIRLETLREANDILSNAISKLPIFKHWSINEDILHASADGQKFETRHHTLKSRYSTKYFGFNQGVVAYTMVANHIPANSKIIGANEYEGHYIFDTVFNNSSEFDIDWLSSDMHGVNQINFALLDFINCQFAPRYTRISHKKNLIYTFLNPQRYKDYLIKPSGRINKKLILEEWDNIQRIVASLMLKETTQNVIVKKLCSYTRKNKTKEALWEYDNIFRSIYVLNYIDEFSVRRNVQKALNRGEAYHQLRRAVGIANGGKFRGNTERELEIWNDCSRLIANCIIFYNAYILSSLLVQQESSRQVEATQFIKSLSPVAWQHINFFGWYDFSENATVIDVEKLVNKLFVGQIAT